VDAGALEIGTLKQEIKFKQDELTYIGSLLDEYARTFETKIGVGEQQVYGQSIETAKQAVENKTLTSAERFSRQTAFAGLTIKRLFDVVGGARFAGVGVDTMGSVMNGQFAMIGPVALFRADSGTAGIAVTQPGSVNPLVRQLEGDIAGTIGPLVASGEGTIALDPSRGGALKELVQKTNIVHIFIKGGPIMWPMLLASCVGLAVVLERIIFLSIEGKRRSAKTQAQFFMDVNKGDLAAAVALAKSTKDAVVSTLGYALERRDQSMAHALTYAETRTMKRYRRGLAILDTVITLAPLLGLLGTVTGMMASFSSIGGDMGSPGAITGGISEALIATAGGLGISLVALIFYSFFRGRVHTCISELESAATHFVALLHAQRNDEENAELPVSAKRRDLQGI
jgi:biopolymer transport protein ExbB